MTSTTDINLLLMTLDPSELDRLLAAAIRERQRRQSIEGVRREVLSRIAQSGYSIEEVLGSDLRAISPVSPK